ncbi:MAG: hypothetical protein ACOYLF_16835 [Blastocatellia bacterium]
MDNKNNWKTWAIILISLLVAGFVQTTLVGLVPPWAGEWLTYIDWLLLVTVYIALQRDPFRAMITGVVAGIVHDALTGADIAWVSGISYVLAAYVTHSVAALFVADSLAVRFVAVTLSSLLSASVRLIFYLILKVSLPALAGGKRVAAYYVFSLLVHLMASILLYILLDRVFMKEDALRQRRGQARRRRRRSWIWFRGQV